ncbi:MAG: transglycosylase SLT domain-containing protein, partial [Myxococcota bacterium]
ADWIEVERGRIALAAGDEVRALRHFDSVWGHSKAIDREIVLDVASLRAEHAPESLFAERDALEEALDPKDANARSAFMGSLLRSLSLHPRSDVDRTELELARYIQEPVSTLTPEKPPRPLNETETLERAEALLAQHRNERVLSTLEPVMNAKMEPALVCRREFTYGFAARKLRKYRSARTHLGNVVSGSCDPELQRRAHFLWAKVISIASGLSAIEPIEKFATTYAGHSMVDDVLFWAGDMYQRRGRRKDAERYYRRIEQFDPPGDQCAISRWRLAWMSHKASEWPEAQKRLTALLKEDGCVRDGFERARAHYWLGRVSEIRGRQTQALEQFSEILAVDPLGWYAQMALGRIRALDSKRFSALIPTAPRPERAPALCAGELAKDEAFLRGWRLRELGLHRRSAAEWLSVDVSQRAVLSGAHATALGKEAKPLEVEQAKTIGSQCTADHPGLLLAIGLSTVGEKAEAQWRLRTTHAEYLSQAPSGEAASLWVAAYPLEARQYLEAAEKESELPTLFLQALSREESAFDDQIVSWAGAYGLTQLLLSTGQSAGRLLEPPVLVTKSEQLLDPGLNARLG